MKFTAQTIVLFLLAAAQTTDAFVTPRSHVASARIQHFRMSSSDDTVDTAGMPTNLEADLAPSTTPATDNFGEDYDGFPSTSNESKSLKITETIYTASMKSPKDAYKAFAEKGAANSKMSKHKIFHQSLMGGMYVGFGGLLSLCISGNIGGVAAMNPGIAKFVFAALFPVNLLLCLTTGGQLFTGNTATGASALYEGLITPREYTKSLAMSLLGNIVGCAMFAWMASYVGLLQGGTAAMAHSMALGKTSYGLGQTLIKGILCNWMVCMAVFLAGASNDLTGKMVGIWFPISTFVGIGLEHSVANLFLFPAALLSGVSLTLGKVLVKNIVPVLVGNLLAGAMVVAGSYSYQFGSLGARRRAIFQERQQKYEAKVAARKASA